MTAAATTVSPPPDADPTAGPCTFNDNGADACGRPGVQALTELGITSIFRCDHHQPPEVNT